MQTGRIQQERQNTQVVSSVADVAITDTAMILWRMMGAKTMSICTSKRIWKTRGRHRKARLVSSVAEVSVGDVSIVLWLTMRPL